MKQLIKYFLLVLNIISLIIGLALSAFIYYCEFLGYDKGNAFLKSINFPLSDNDIILACFICVVILFLSIFLRKKFFQ